MTLAKVAKEANVAIMTASKVFNGDPSVRSYLRERVLEAARRIDYQPNILARGLRSKSASIVSLGVQQLDNPFFGALAGNMCRLLMDQGLVGVLCNNISRIREVNQTACTCGTILVSGTPEMIEELHKTTILVTVTSRTPSTDLAPEIGIDFQTAYTELVTELLASGRTHISVYCPDSEWAVNEEAKFRFLKQAVKEQGGVWVERSSSAFATCDDVVAWIKEGKRLDALCCANDTLAVYLSGVLSTSLPDWQTKLLLVGCDGNMILPGGWSLRIDMESLAGAAVAALEGRLNGTGESCSTSIVPVLTKMAGFTIGGVA